MGLGGHFEPRPCACRAPTSCATHPGFEASGPPTRPISKPRAAAGRRGRANVHEPRTQGRRGNLPAPAARAAAHRPNRALDARPVGGGRAGSGCRGVGGVDLARLVFADVAPRQAHLQRLRRRTSRWTHASTTPTRSLRTTRGRPADGHGPYSPAAEADSSTATRYPTRPRASRVVPRSCPLGLAEEVVASDWDDAYEELAVGWPSTQRCVMPSRAPSKGSHGGQLAMGHKAREGSGRRRRTGVGRKNGGRRRLSTCRPPTLLAAGDSARSSRKIRHYQEQGEKSGAVEVRCDDALREPDAAQRRIARWA